ncbi:ABC transporter ATP-binding protein [Kribbella sp. ALI-6-A]|uniref:ABC transporter ATP-binding protein n=1 Tax=Kribbella sp. ALI-6-A TaxID=1933817 RepID=UPI00192D048E|nr:ABC transporter ATP-binding protein [Kribbella sp. ALI-6-A]
MSVLLEIEDLTLRVPAVEILRGISLQVATGETVGLVGESGSGKSSTARAALRLFPDEAQAGGRISVGGVDVLSAGDAAVQRIRAHDAAMIFQAPRTALNPVRRIGDSATERLVQVHGLDRKAARAKLLTLFEHVGLRDPESLLRKYPHQLSGGMLQRVVIAAALSIDPKLLLADEATSALDVTTQAEVLALLKRLRGERDLGVLFITHDLHLAAAYCDRVYVMREGLIVDHQPGATIFENPGNEYTRQLADAVPTLPAQDSTETGKVGSR